MCIAILSVSLIRGSGHESLLQYPGASAAICKGKKQIQKSLSSQKLVNAPKINHNIQKWIAEFVFMK